RNNNQKETNETMMKMKGLDDYKEINDAAVYSSSHRPSRNIRPRWHQDPRGGNHGHKKDHKSQFSCHSRRLESHCLSHVTSHLRVSHAFDRLRQRNFEKVAALAIWRQNSFTLSGPGILVQFQARQVLHSSHQD